VYCLQSKLANFGTDEEKYITQDQVYTCENAIAVATESMELLFYSKTTKFVTVLKLYTCCSITFNKQYLVANCLMDKHSYEKALSKFVALLS